jgi:peptide/nickel transport system substrate-binding protein
MLYDLSRRRSEITARLYLAFMMLATGAGLFGAAAASNGGMDVSVRNGGTFRVALAGGNWTIDPTLASPDAGVFALLDATCARLMTYPDSNPPKGYRLVREVARRYSVSPDGKKYTFVLRRGFRFSDGTRVRASAFSWAITRSLRLAAAGAENLGSDLVQDIAGAKAVAAGRAERVSGIIARGNRLVIRLVRPLPEFPARLTLFCAVPPGLPVNPEGVETFHAAGPYYVAENVRARRIVLRRNKFYGGSRPWHVTSIVADGQAGDYAEVVDRIHQGLADWGWAPSLLFFDPSRGIVAKYGLNKSRFWVRPGLTLHHYPFNNHRRLFRNNPSLRRAVNFAVNRPAIRRQLVGVALGGRLTDQYLPPGLPGFRDARIYPLEAGPKLKRAKALARGHLHGGKAVLYVPNRPFLLSAAHVIARNLAKIGLDVEVTALPAGPVYYERLADPDEPWDIAFAGWTADHLDPFTYLNELFDARFIGVSNVGRFNVSRYNRLLRQADARKGAARYRAYGALDVQLASKAAPSVAIQWATEATLVSANVDKRCIVLRPTLDVAVACLKP